jgi:hypothetical protein
MSIIAAGTTTTTALSSTGNTDGTLQFQVNGTTPSVTLNTLGAIGVGSSPSYGTSGQVLTSGGSTVAPSWATPAAVNLASGVTGTLPIANGGTNSTATPTAGGIVYGDGSAHQITSAGTSGQVLTSAGAGTPTWSTPSSGAMVFITSATASNSSTLNVENAMTAYGMYLIVATGLNMSGAGYLQALLKIGGSYQTTNYNWVTNRAQTPGTKSSNSGDTFIRLGEGNSLPNNTSYGMMLYMWLPNPSSSQYKTTSSVLSGFDQTLDIDFYNGAGGYKGSTGALTGVQFFCNNARTFNGVFRLYGIANS